MLNCERNDAGTKSERKSDLLDLFRCQFPIVKYILTILTTFGFDSIPSQTNRRLRFPVREVRESDGLSSSVFIKLQVRQVPSSSKQKSGIQISPMSDTRL